MITNNLMLTETKSRQRLRIQCSKD